VYKLRKLLETEYKMTREQFRHPTDITPNGFVTHLNLTVNALPNQFKGVRGIGPTEQHALNDACQRAYNGLILYHKEAKFNNTGRSGVSNNLNGDMFFTLKGVLDRVRKDTGLEDMKNVPKYESGSHGGFIASLKNDPLCPDFLNDFAFTGEGNSKKEARIHAESKLLCFLIQDDPSKITDFLNTKNGMITQKKVWKFLKETKVIGSEQAFDYKPTLQPLVSENLNCRKRKANPDENQAPNRDAELNKVPNSNPEQKENINYNSIEDISSPASKKFHKNLVELQNLEDDLPDYDEMEDRSESDNFGRLIETSSLAESCPDTTLLPLTDEEDNNQIQENSKFTKSFQNR